MLTESAGPEDLDARAQEYFRDVAEEDLTELRPLGLDTIVARHARLAATDRAGERIDVHAHERTGTSSIQIVTPDVPFVVDSVLNVLIARGLRIGPVVHPVMTGPRGPESWILIQVAGLLRGREAEECVSAVAAVIADVHVVARSEGALATTLDAVIRSAATSDPAAHDFLLWMRRGRFDLYGYRTADEMPASSPIGLTAGPVGRRTSAGIEVKTTLVRTFVRRHARLDRVMATVEHSDGTLRTHCFDGLFTAVASADPITSVPLANEKADAIADATAASPNSHAGRAVHDVLQSLPRDEVLRAPLAHLMRVVTDVRRLSERRAARAFIRVDEEEHAARVLVFLPRDWYSTDVRVAIQSALRRSFGDERIDFTVRLGDKSLAQVAFSCMVGWEADTSDEGLRSLERRISDICTPWSQRLEARARAEGLPAGLSAMFPSDYVAVHDVDAALQDARSIMAASPRSGFAVLSVTDAGDDGGLDLRLFSRRELALADLLPTVQSLGLVAVDERSWALRGDVDGGQLVRLRVRAVAWPRGADQALLIPALEEIGAGTVEADGLNRLVTSGGLSWQQVEVLRTYVRYLRQLNATFTHGYVAEVLTQRPALSRMLVELFAARFQPGRFGTPADRTAGAARLEQQFSAALDEVQTADADRILRELLTLVNATVRTNAYDAAGGLDPRPAVALKLETTHIPFAPAPRPIAEIWVHSQNVEGVHLRFSAIARGGLRWSDRLEDFRTEVLGLAKAQTVKNAVIVPGGAKGGFVLKADRSGLSVEEWSALGREAYRVFIRALLDVTDDVRRDGAGERIERADRIIAHDRDDPYLVVAADKGTANLSDVANEISADRRFWLGDAFASGGSNGYDHKALGITARGAWESVRRHFSEIGRDPDRDEVTVVGIGDMSGDVFGNGMLLSRSIRLVAAFDYRHIFVDPSADAESSYRERARLFGQPRSSWADYDRSLISAGGGVFERSAKTVPVTAEMRDILGLDDAVTVLTPTALISAILRAPVDLLWNGGVGTYVKASAESHGDAADRANDAVRVDGRSLRVRVVGEGGNLGFTQAARVEAARAGVRLNTDAIDNSAGVDCSDHEVNIKIALHDAVAAHELAASHRDEVLASMAEEVSNLVLRDNYEQNVLLANERAKAAEMLPVHQRFLQWLERERSLDRALEGLPSDDELLVRQAEGAALVSPELAVVAALAKLAVKKDLEGVNFVEEPFGVETLLDYFPARVRELRGNNLTEHRLAASIVATSLANDIVNIGGVTFVFRAQEESGATADQVVRAFAVAREVFQIDALRAEIRAGGSGIPADIQARVHSEIRRLMDRATRWLLQRAAGVLDVEAARHALTARIAPLLGTIPGRLFGQELEAVERELATLVAAGVAPSLAARAAALLYEFRLLDVSEVASRTGATMARAVEAYMAVCDRYGVSRTLQQIAALPRDGRWHPLARTSLRADLEQVVSAVAAGVLRSHAEDLPSSIDAWERSVSRPILRAREALREVGGLRKTDFAAVSVAIRLLREATDLDAAVDRTPPE